MRAAKYALLALAGAALLVVAFANHDPVTLRLLPEEAAPLTGFDATLTLPLFLVILAAVVIGLVAGYAFEWLRAHKHRAEAARNRREVERLAEENRHLKQAEPPVEDDVLALLRDQTDAG